jgi:hypothetical protein
MTKAIPHRAAASLVSKIAAAGALYFALVFAAGFLLGVVRELLLVPRVGIRTAELCEIPVMLCLAFLAARWVVRRRELPPTVASRLGMGAVALALLLAAELAVAIGLRGASLSEAFASRDPVSGAAYRVALALFALMPLVVGRRAV